MDKIQKQQKNQAEKTISSPPKKIVSKKPSNDDFKRRYFEFYDDIKISDRQDW